MLIKTTLSWGGDVLKTEIVDESAQGPCGIALTGYYVEQLMTEKEIRNNADKTTQDSTNQF